MLPSNLHQETDTVPLTGPTFPQGQRLRRHVVPEEEHGEHHEGRAIQGSLPLAHYPERWPLRRELFELLLSQPVILSALLNRELTLPCAGTSWRCTAPLMVVNLAMECRQCMHMPTVARRRSAIGSSPRCPLHGTAVTCAMHP